MGIGGVERNWGEKESLRVLLCVGLCRTGFSLSITPTG